MTEFAAIEAIRKAVDGYMWAARLCAWWRTRREAILDG